MTSASNQLVNASHVVKEARDSLNRSIKFKRITALDRLRILKIAGPDLSQNDAWLNLAALAYSVIEIDGIPRAVPTAERQIESTIAELGDTGLKALIEQISSEPNDDLLSHGEPAGNALGTPS